MKPPTECKFKVENGVRKWPKKIVCDGENLWQWYWLVLAFRRLAIPQKQFIITINPIFHEEG